MKTDWIQGVASAACLSLNEEELSRLAFDVGEELARLSADPLSGIPERWEDEAVDMTSLREDHPTECLDREELLALSSSRNDTAFVVPRVLGGEEETV